MKRITSSQALQIGSVLGAVALKTGLPSSEVQRVLERRAKALGEDFADFLIRWVLQDPEKLLIRDIDLDKMPNDQLPPWKDQLEQMKVLYPNLSTDGIQKQIEDSRSPERTFDFYGGKRRLWDNWIIFPLPGRVASKEGIGNLWEDLYKPPRRRQGIWLKLCCHMFQKIRPLYEDFYTYFASFDLQRMLPNDFLPLDEVAKLLLDMEMSIKGDFACVPCNLWSFCLGHAPIAAFWKIRQVYGTPCPAWVTGHMMAYHRLELFPMESKLISTGDRFVRRTGLGGASEEYVSFFEVNRIGLHKIAWWWAKPDEIMEGASAPFICGFAGDFDE